MENTQTFMHVRLLQYMHRDKNLIIAILNGSREAHEQILLTSGRSIKQKLPWPPKGHPKFILGFRNFNEPNFPVFPGKPPRLS